MFGDPDWRNLTWVELLPLVNDTPYPPRFALNDEITMASSANDLVSFYARALSGEIFRYSETLAAFRTILSLKDEIAQIFPLGVNAFVKGGSLDAFSDHVLSAAGGMYAAQRWVYFAVILNWNDAEAGTDGGAPAQWAPTLRCGSPEATAAAESATRVGKNRADNPRALD